MTIAAGLRPNGKSVFHELLMSNMLTRLQNRVTNQKQNKNIRSFTKKKRASEKKSLARRRGHCSGRFYANFLTHNRRKDSTGEISETTGRYRFIIILS